MKAALMFALIALSLNTTSATDFTDCVAPPPPPPASEDCGDLRNEPEKCAMYQRVASMGRLVVQRRVVNGVPVRMISAGDGDLRCQQGHFEAPSVTIFDVDARRIAVIQAGFATGSTDIDATPIPGAEGLTPRDVVRAALPQLIPPASLRDVMSVDVIGHSDIEPSPLDADYPGEDPLDHWQCANAGPPAYPTNSNDCLALLRAERVRGMIHDYAGAGLKDAQLIASSTASPFLEQTNALLKSTLYDALDLKVRVAGLREEFGLSEEVTAEALRSEAYRVQINHVLATQREAYRRRLSPFRSVVVVVTYASSQAQ